ncbi:hypothetical protein [Novosphingobium panipatense]|uniref:Uncharacterized protein n=1 Tax=Novosphingobium panipatense TaxID=428991 RepID=A0ABY1QUB0_9SPHN|nr:hypothetical protein [Novosphingobium panipatense]SMP80449.1 hypothetical protein SAMN06296065_11436 [Novosphingobium panipatense]
MGLNELLFHHQVALIQYAADNKSSRDNGTSFDVVRHYEARIARLRHEIGAAAYPRWP